MASLVIPNWGMKGETILATRNGLEEVFAFVPPTLDGVNDTETVITNCSHALRVAEGMAVVVVGASLACAVLQNGT